MIKMKGIEILHMILYTMDTDFTEDLFHFFNFGCMCLKEMYINSREILLFLSLPS